MKNNEKRHYFLASTRVVFMMPDGETPGVSEHNCVLDHSSKTVSTKELGKIQQLAQMIFRQRVAPDPQIEVKDVFIIAISYLGLMSGEEFQPTEETKPVSKPLEMSPLLNPGKSTQHGEIDHVSTTDRGRSN